MVCWCENDNPNFISGFVIHFTLHRSGDYVSPTLSDKQFIEDNESIPEL